MPREEFNDPELVPVDLEKRLDHLFLLLTVERDENEHLNRRVRLLQFKVAGLQRKIADLEHPKLPL